MHTKKLWQKPVGITLMALAVVAVLVRMVPAAEVTEAQVFEWWDDGTIEAGEANELLGLIDDGNMQEACALAEIYVNEPCEMMATDDGGASKMPAARKSSGRKRPPKSQKNYGGHFSAKVRFDSAGHVVAHREELRFDFHRLSLRLGTQELLTYKGKRGEAHFGQISTREMHSGVPLDTLWGTSLVYSFGKLHVSALLDTSGVSRAFFGYSAGKFLSAEASLWNAPESHSVSLQASVPSGRVVAWYQAGQSFPLVRFSLRGREAPAFSWSTTGYLHGDSVPAPARLSASILRNRFWTTQNITYRTKGFLDTRVSASARILSPLHSDSVSGRLAIDVSGGPPVLRIGAKFTCREASENCRQTFYQGAAQSTYEFSTLSATLSGSARTQHDRADNSWGRPRLEIGAAVSEAGPGRRDNLFKVSLVAPDARPHESLRFQSEARLAGDILELSLVASFKKFTGAKFRPAHAQISSKILF